MYLERNVHVYSSELWKFLCTSKSIEFSCSKSKSILIHRFTQVKCSRNKLLLYSKWDAKYSLHTFAFLYSCMQDEKSGNPSSTIFAHIHLMLLRSIQFTWFALVSHSWSVSHPVQMLLFNLFILNFLLNSKQTVIIVK